MMNGGTLPIKYEDHKFTIDLIPSEGMNDDDEPIYAIQAPNETMHKIMGHSHHFPPEGKCEVCVAAKIKKLPFARRDPEMRSKGFNDLMHADLVGPMTTPGITGAKYLCVFVDDHTRYICVYACHSKDNAAESLEKYLTEQGKPKCIRTDGGGEFVGGRFLKICTELWIIRQITVAETPQ